VKLLVLAFAAGMGTAFAVQMRALYRTWGLLPDADRAFPGDDLVEAPEVVETRYIDIDAPPAAVWPWLVQLGYDRGGWYSYGPLDRPWSPAGGRSGRSVESILEEFQDLAEGDLVPTHPAGGFVARVVERERVLALYLDDSMMLEQLDELKAESNLDTDADVDISQMDMPPYAVSWTFVLEDAAGERTRLIERMRFRIDVSRNQRKGMPLLAVGVFVLMRSQLLGIKRRAEEHSRSAD